MSDVKKYVVFDLHGKQVEVVSAVQWFDETSNAYEVRGPGMDVSCCKLMYRNRRGEWEKVQDGQWVVTRADGTVDVMDEEPVVVG